MTKSELIAAERKQQRAKIAALMADRRERTRDDIVRATGIHPPYASKALMALAEMGLLSRVEVNNTWVYRAAEVAVE